MEKDIVAVVHDNIIEMVDLSGASKTSKKIGLPRFEFDFKVEGMGKIHTNSRILNWKFNLILLFIVIVQNDSILAFHSHGMQGRSLRNGAITQEISDPSKVYRLVGSEK